MRAAAEASYYRHHDRGDWPIRANSSQEAPGIAPLDRVGWLADQPADFRAWAARVGRWKKYAAGQFIYHAGDPPDGLYGLAAGGLEITFPLVAAEPVVIYRADVGYWIGDNAELANQPRMVSLKAAKDSRLLCLPSGEIRALLERDPRHWQSFYRLNSLNIGMAVTLLSEVLALTVRARVSRRLLQLTERSSEAAITQEDLGRLVGVTRTTLRRCLADLAQRGAIEMEYRKLRVLNREVLAAFRDEQ